MRQLVIVATVLCAAALAWSDDAWEGDLLNVGNKIDGTLGVTYDTMYVWRGFRIFDNKSATHILGDVTLADSGFGVSAFGHIANAGGFNKYQRWDYTAYYQNALFTDESYVTNFRLGYVYYNYPGRNSYESIDMEELHAVLSWPKILGIDGLCPSYVAVKMWPATHDSEFSRLRINSPSGFLQIAMLDYGFTVTDVIPGFPDQLFKLHAEIVYNDGVTPLPSVPNPDHGFSDAVFGASTDFDLSPLLDLKASSLVFTPGIFYQDTLEKSIDPKGNELWGSFGLRYSF
jgi:hypothetical protein